MGSGDSRIIAGAMSGTSADGIDVALVRVTGRGLGMSAELLHHHARPYDAALKQAIFAVRGSGQTSLADLAALGRSISLEYAAAVNAALAEANLKAADLAAVAAHGQTLYHAPPNTIQWLDPALIAAEVGCAVVSDFRRADCAAGGQGAPLVPFADYILFRHPTKSRVLLNIGGIANLTYIPAGATMEQVIAFDTGPGNCIIDHIARLHDPTGPGYDVEGRSASTAEHWGWELADWFIKQPYFLLPPPKSTDGPSMIAVFESAPLAKQPYLGVCDRDSQRGAAMLSATACLSTAKSIAFAMRLLPGKVDELLVSGGGTKNRFLIGRIQFEACEFGPPLRATAEVGVPGEAKEAIAFALLGAATLDGVPSNVPSCTGAKRAVVLGSVTPRP